MYDELINFIRSLYSDDFIPLHAPRFLGNEKQYLNKCIDSTFVSSVGEFVSLFEEKMSLITGCKYAVATMNGTSALHMALILANVEKDDEVLTQALTFVATANAIAYTGATSIFLDSGKDNLGMSYECLKNFLEENAQIKADGFTYNKLTSKRIKACVPMHVFGHPVNDLEKMVELCREYNIILIEDAAEAIGSSLNGKSLGSFGDIGIFSFNGNKTVTSGGGGVIVTNNEKYAQRAKYLTTTAKRAHEWDFYHTEIAYNYRLPNLNAALICAQLEQLENFVENKRETAKQYKSFFESNNLKLKFLAEPEGAKSSYWLNAVICQDLKQRDELLRITNENKIMTRPIWKLMSELPAFENCQKTELSNAKFFEQRIVNLPSSVRV